MTEALARHFLALVPGGEARSRLSALPLPDGGRPVHPDDLHLTLAFLGDLPAFTPEALLRALEPACRLGLVEVTLDGLECWRGPRAFCAVGPRGSAAALADAVRARLEGLGHRHEARPFRTHVTLARGLPAVACAEPPRPLTPSIGWTSDTLYLLASRGRPVEPGQPRYVVLASRPLG